MRESLAHDLKTQHDFPINEIPWRILHQKKKKKNCKMKLKIVTITKCYNSAQICIYVYI